MTRPTRRDFARRMRPTWQCFCRILVLAVASRMPITLGTRHRTVGRGGGDVAVEVEVEAAVEAGVEVVGAAEEVGAEAVEGVAVAAASVGEPEHVRNRCPLPGRLPRGGGCRPTRHALD